MSFRHKMVLIAYMRSFPTAISFAKIQIPKSHLSPALEPRLYRSRLFSDVRLWLDYSRGAGACHQGFVIPECLLVNLLARPAGSSNCFPSWKQEGCTLRGT